jgi:hypothetical protein
MPWACRWRAKPSPYLVLSGANQGRRGSAIPGPVLISSVGLEAAQRTSIRMVALFLTGFPRAQFRQRRYAWCFRNSVHSTTSPIPIVNAPEAYPFTLVAAAVHMHLTSAVRTPVAVSRIPSLKRRSS